MGWGVLDLLDNIHTDDDFTEDNMAAIQPEANMSHQQQHQRRNYNECSWYLHYAGSMHRCENSPRGRHSSEEELGAVGVRTSVGHGQISCSSVLQLEVLICELLSVDGLAAGAITVGEVTSLDHEVLDDAVESASALE